MDESNVVREYISYMYNFLYILCIYGIYSESNHILVYKIELEI